MIKVGVRLLGRRYIQFGGNVEHHQATQRGKLLYSQKTAALSSSVIMVVGAVTRDRQDGSGMVHVRVMDSGGLLRSLMSLIIPSDRPIILADQINEIYEMLYAH